MDDFGIGSPLAIGYIMVREVDLAGLVPRDAQAVGISALPCAEAKVDLLAFFW